MPECPEAGLAGTQTGVSRRASAARPAATIDTAYARPHVADHRVVSQPPSTSRNMMAMQATTGKRLSWAFRSISNLLSVMMGAPAGGDVRLHLGDGTAAHAR